jgi:type I restriction enzyme R subunit
MRPIFSPTDFIQIKGRGTRKFIFNYKQKNELGEIEEIRSDKQRFKLFDFFANCEYFEEKFKYDEVLKLPKGTQKHVNEDETYVLHEKPSTYENVGDDPLKSLKETEIGFQGMRIDRELFDRFEHEIKSNKEICEKFESGNITGAENFVKQKIFGRPQQYYDLEKLRKSLKLDRRVSLREILDKIFGRISKFKNKDELLDEEIEKFISIYKPEPRFIQSIRNFIKAYITEMEIRDIMDKKEYSRLATNPKFSMHDLREIDGWLEPAIDYIKDYVSLNAFV